MSTATKEAVKQSPPVEALNEFLKLRDESAELEHDCDLPEFSRCDLCEIQMGIEHRIRSMRDLWADRWAVILRDEMTAKAEMLEALEMVIAIMCDKEICGHFLPKEIREVVEPVIQKAKS